MIATLELDLNKIDPTDKEDLKEVLKEYIDIPKQLLLRSHAVEFLQETIQQWLILNGKTIVISDDSESDGWACAICHDRGDMVYDHLENPELFILFDYEL